jgi:hypothetical protein
VALRGFHDRNPLDAATVEHTYLDARPEAQDPGEMRRLITTEHDALVPALERRCVKAVHGASQS